MTSNRRTWYLGGRPSNSPLHNFWQLGTLSDVDPDIPNLPLETTKKLTAEVGSYSLTGSTATLKFNHVLSAIAGSFSFTGATAQVLVGKVISADATSYSLSGVDVALTYVPTGGTNPTLSVDAGSYSLSGATAQLLKGSKLSAAVGAYSWSGVTAVLRATRLLSAGISSYSLTGTISSLKHGYLLSTAVGGYTVLGSPANFNHSYGLSASAGSYSLTGTLVNLNRGKYLSVTPESYFITGSLVSTLYQRYIIHPFTGTDLLGAHEYFPWHNKDGLTVYFNKGGKKRHRYFPEDIERQDVIVRKRLEIANPTATQELDWDAYNFFDVSLNTDVTFTFSNPRDNSDFIILLTKDANGTVRNITWPASLAWPDGTSFTSLSSSSETKLLRISYFGGRYRATLY